MRYIHRLKIHAKLSYSLSRYNAQASDGDFVNSALDFNNTGKYIGPNGLDRTSQLSGGVVMELPLGFRMDIISHWYTALPQTLTFNAPGNPEDIFQIDTVGDGQTGVAPIPGTNVGFSGCSIKASDINNALNKYSNTYGNQLTPAGQALVSACSAKRNCNRCAP